jgi:hypothetical protein
MLLAKPCRPVWPLKGYKWSIGIQAAVDGTILADVNKDGTPVEIPCVRVFGRRLDKYSSAAYWDITSVTLATMLEAFLRSGILIGKSVTISTTGRGNTRRDTISIGPIPL